MLKLLPAIDLIDNQCVRLVQGDYGQKTTYGSDPVAVAKDFEAQGADVLHVVDLSGAKQGSIAHLEMIKKIRESISIPMEVGGGVRTKEAVKQLIEVGVERIILGTVLIKDKEFAKNILQEYPDRIVFGIDGRDDKVAVSGWLEETDVTVIDLIKEYEEFGLTHVIYTDINKDGLLQGANLIMLRRILEETNINLVASGGVSSLADIEKIRNIDINEKLFGVITGKDLYENKFTVKQAKDLILNAK